MRKIRIHVRRYNRIHKTVKLIWKNGVFELSDVVEDMSSQSLHSGAICPN